MGILVSTSNMIDRKKGREEETHLSEGRKEGKRIDVSTVSQTSCGRNGSLVYCGDFGLLLVGLSENQHRIMGHGIPYMCLS